MLSQPKHLAWQIAQGVVYAMVVTLFMVWVVFGSVTVSSQNATILQGVQAQGQANYQAIQKLIEKNTIGDRTITCILLVDPSKRNEHTTQKCLTAAEHGLNHLP